MSAPKSYRWPPELAARISDYQTRMGLETDAEAVTELVKRGLEADNSELADCTQRSAWARELRAGLAKVEQLSGQSDASFPGELISAIEALRFSLKRSQEQLCKADHLANLAGHLQSWPELKEFSRLLDVWTVVYQLQLAAVPSDSEKTQITVYWHAMLAGKELLRQLGVGNSVTEEIEARRPVTL